MMAPRKKTPDTVVGLMNSLRESLDRVGDKTNVMMFPTKSKAELARDRAIHDRATTLAAKMATLCTGNPHAADIIERLIDDLLDPSETDE